MKFLRILFSVSLMVFFSAEVTAQISNATDLLDSLLMSSEREAEAEKPESRPSLEGIIRNTQEYMLKINQVQRIIKNELDTAEIANEINVAEGLFLIVEERLKNVDTKINLRYLTALENLMSSISSKVKSVEVKVRSRVDNLAQERVKIDSIKRDDIVQYNLRDTTLLPEYQVAISTLRSNLDRTDSALNAQRLQTLNFQTRISNITIKINEIGDNLSSQKRVLERALFNKENNFIWEPKDFPNTEKLTEVFMVSLKINQAIVSRYIKSHLGITVFLVILVFLINYWVGSNLKKIRSEKEFSTIILGRVNYVPKYPFLSSMMVILAIAPFFYPHPPVSFFSLVLTLLVTISGVLIRKRVGKKLYQVWWMMFFLFVISTASNLYWEIAYQERWHLLVFNSFGIYLGLRLMKLQKANDEIDIPSYIRIFARVYIGFCSISILANVLGRFSLSKMIGITATLSLMHAIALVVLVIIIKEFIYLQLEVSRKSESDFTSMLDFNDIQNRVNKMSTYLAAAIWGY